MSRMAPYRLGVLLLVTGLGIAAYLLNVPLGWIAVCAVVVLGLGATLARRGIRP